MKKASERLSAVRDVIAHLGHPHRLSQNVLTAAHFGSESNPAIGAARVKRLIEQVLDRLPLRQRQIVQRCDFDGETHPAVTSALGISERHFYRERRNAFESIAAALANAERAPDVLPSEEQFEHLGLSLSLADAAHQVGDSARALRILGTAERDVGDATRLIYLECRLAEFCAEAGAADEATHHVEVARHLCSRLAVPEGRDITLRVDAVEAAVAWKSGQPEVRLEVSERVVPALRGALGRRAHPRDAEALALALLVLSERDLTIGRWRTARRGALEAREALAIADPGRPALGLRVDSAATTAYMLDSGHVADAAFELEREYRLAIGRGLVLEATLIAWRLFNCHRFAGKNRLAVSLLEGVVPIASDVIPHAELSAMSLDLASGYVACGEPAKARHMTSRVQRHAGGHAAAHSSLIQAEAFLLERDFVEALRSSQAGLDALRRLTHDPSVHYVGLGFPSEGWALRIQADAHRALGNGAAARNLIGAALQFIDSSSHPVVVAKTHSSAARITGKSVHRRIAKSLLGQFGQSN